MKRTYEKPAVEKVSIESALALRLGSGGSVNGCIPGGGTTYCW